MITMPIDVTALLVNQHSFQLAGGELIPLHTPEHTSSLGQISLLRKSWWARAEPFVGMRLPTGGR